MPSNPDTTLGGIRIYIVTLHGESMVDPMPPEEERAERYVFDACALIAYLNDEVGARASTTAAAAASAAPPADDMAL